MPERVNNEVFNRPPRLQPGELDGEITIPSPSNQQDDSGRSLLLSLLPMSSILVMGVFYLLISASTNRSPLFALPLLAMGLVTVLTSLLTHSYQRQQQRQRGVKAERDYHRQLDRREARLLAARELQQHMNLTRYPPVQRLEQMIQQDDEALWNHRTTDPDFSAIRLGQGDIPSRVTVKNPDPDIVTPGIRRALDLSFQYRMLPDVSVSLHLLETGSVGVVGARQQTLKTVYAMLAQLVGLHLPGDLTLYVFSTRATYRDWNWVRWLPHTSTNNTGGFPDTVAYQPEDSRRLLGQLTARMEQTSESPLAQGLAVVIVDSPSHIHTSTAFRAIIRGRSHGIVCICLAAERRQVPSDCQAMIEVDENAGFRVAYTGPEARQHQGMIDRLSRTRIDMIARKLIQYNVPQADGAQSIPASVRFLQMYGVEAIGELEIERLWSPHNVPKGGKLPYAVPVGNTDYANQLMLDLRDNIHGPHGMVAGTTGSGKSELLRTLVVALAVAHHPYYLNFLLIDFKGGSTFKAFEALPHTVGSLSNIDGIDPKQSRIEALRLLEAIKSENMRRQIFLKNQGFDDITDYHKQLARAGRIPDDWEPMPHLLIIIDEFAELATDLPDFIPELVSTVRVGRSLGMHLILAMQRPGNYVKEEMRANLQFRICLRVQSDDDSRDMLGRTEAAELPTNIPGRAYFQVGSSGLQQFQTARVNIDYLPDEADLSDEAEIDLIRYEEQIAHETDTTELPAPTGDKPPLLLEKLVERMAALYERMDARSMTPILLPSLPPETFLTDLVADLGGWDGQSWQPLADDGPMRVPFGQVDDIVKHANTPLEINLEYQNGHFLAIGGPSSGKTTFLRTVALSLAHLYPPDQIEIYALSFGGHSLQGILDLPHVGAVISAGETERTGRLLSYLLTEMAWRATQFARRNVVSLRAYNERLATTQPGDNEALRPCTRIIVLIDNFAEFKNSHQEEMTDFMRLMQNGAYGIHFIISATQLNDVPYPIQSQIDEQRLALRLPERTDYTLFVGSTGDRPLSTHPGSGLIKGTPPLRVQVALPAAGQTAAGQTEEQREEQITNTIQQMQHAGNQLARARAIEILPPGIALYHDAPAGSNDAERPSLLGQLPTRQRGSGNPPYAPLHIPVGIRGDNLQPLVCDLHEDGPHFLISGPVGSGGTNLLSVFGLVLAQRYHPTEAHLLLIDFSGRELSSLSTLPHVVGSVTNEDTFDEHLPYLLATLEERAAQKAPRHTHRPIVVLIDAYDQMLESLTHQQQALLDHLSNLLRRHPDLAVHVIAAAPSSSTPSGKLMKQLKVMRSGFALSDAETVGTLGGRVTSRMRNMTLPEGRGFYVRHGQPQLVQIAHIADYAPVVAHIRQHWQNAAQAPAQAQWTVSQALVEQIHMSQAAPEPTAPPPSNDDRDSSLSVSNEEANDLLGEWLADYNASKEDNPDGNSQ